MRYLIALIQNAITYNKRKKIYQKAIDLNSIITFKINSGEIKWPDSEGWNIMHPGMTKALSEFIDNVKNSIIKHNTIGFGDSLLAAMMKYSSQIKTKYNFSIPGSWAHHIKHMIDCIVPILRKYKSYKNVQYIIIGSLGGNPFLQRQPLKITLQKSLEALDFARKKFKDAKLIIFGMPPTVCNHANSMSLQFEAGIYEWVYKDNNSVFLPLHNKFSKVPTWFYLWQSLTKTTVYYPPKMAMTHEGIHMSPLGKYYFEKLLRKAKKAKPRRIID